MSSKFVRGWFLAWLILLVPILVRAQSQNLVALNGSGPSHISRAVPWGMATGSTGVGFVWHPTSGSNYACLLIQNNNIITTKSNVIVSGWASLDPQVNIQFSAGGTNTGLSGSAYLYPTYYGTNNSFSAFQAGLNSFRVGSVPIGGAAQAVVQISNATSSGLSGDTFDFVEIDSPVACVNANAMTGTNFSPTTDGTGVIANRPCTQKASFTVANNSTFMIANGAGTAFGGGGLALAITPRIHVCAYSISGPATTTSGTVTFEQGNSTSTCTTTLSGNYWQITTGIGIPNYALASPGDIFTSSSVNALCIVNTATGVTLGFAVAFDIY